LFSATDEAQEFDLVSTSSPVQLSTMTPAERRAQRQADRQARRDQRRNNRQMRRANRRDATTRFCTRLLSRNRGLIDPIRLNRIRLVISFMESVVNSIDGVNPDDIEATGVVAAGGGSALPWYGKVITVVSAQTVSFVGAAVDTRIANLDVCRSL